MMLLALLALSSPVHAQQIEMLKPGQFSEAEVKIVEKLSQEFNPRLTTLLPTRIRIGKVRSSDPNKSNYTHFDPRKDKQQVTIYISRSIQDPVQFAATVCHELGHVMAAGPINSSGSTLRDYWIKTYTPTEGQADYFAAMKCIPRLKDVLPVYGTHPLCQDAKDPARCSLVINVGQIEIDALLKNRASGNPLPAVKIGDRSRLRLPYTTYTGYQDEACRLQSWVAGALCDEDPYRMFSPTNEDEGACVTGKGARPRCWYARGTEAHNTLYGEEANIGLK
jgi:hypothetical protein